MPEKESRAIMQSNKIFCQITTLKFLLQNKINRKMPLFIRE